MYIPGEDIGLSPDVDVGCSMLVHRRVTFDT